MFWKPPQRRRLMLAAAWLLCAAGPARAVYAPVPEVEREKALTLYTTLGTYYDTNIFGAPTNERGSLVLQAVPQLVYNLPAGKQTWVSLGYRLQWDHFLDRPENSDLDGHRFSAKWAHTFSKRWESQVDAHLDFVRNPESLLAGVGQLLSGEQSYRSTTVEARTNWLPNQRTNISLRIKALDLFYDTSELGSELDRREALVTFSYGYLVSPRTLALAEIDFLPVRYQTGAELKDKDVYRLLAGFDYFVGRTVALTARFGGEQRHRNDGNESLPYGELGWKWDYSEGCYVSFGYAYALDEVSNITRYHDASVNRFFVNVLQRVRSNITVGATLGYEPSRLNGRAGISGDRSETIFKVGLSATYHVSKRWDITATFDRDDITSEDPARPLSRTRAGIASQWRF